MNSTDILAAPTRAGIIDRVIAAHTGADLDRVREVLITTDAFGGYTYPAETVASWLKVNGYKVSPSSVRGWRRAHAR